MTKHQFLKELDKAFSGLPKEEKEELIQYYEEYLDNARLEGKTEAEILEELGKPSQIAEAYLEANSVVPLEQKAYEQLALKGFWKRFFIQFLFIGGLLLLGIICLSSFVSIFLLLADIIFFRQIILFQIFILLFAIGVLYITILGIRQLWFIYTTRRGRFL
ncbi:MULTISPECIES: DUF1700 domain-containing protein [Listeria]|uniref:DUF1700 domain-containing protein n=1 Tax=Listeria TaxID=1637 RepID=UPI000B58AB47|nr:MULTISPECIES: DUF1700 domain-containing protein [Listeria]